MDPKSQSANPEAEKKNCSHNKFDGSVKKPRLFLCLIKCLIEEDVFGLLLVILATVNLLIDTVTQTYMSFIYLHEPMVCRKEQIPNLC